VNGVRQPDVFLEPVLDSHAMRELDEVLRVVAPKDIAISLSGESGVGKEIIARRAHDLSPRRAAPFIPINCAAIPESLFESELFGHERGAFTGANARALGKLEAADGGTLFLDELGEMPLAVQAKLLRFLENRKFMRVGGVSKISVDIRLITATLRPLEQEVQAGRFRGDLFYRIQGVMLDVPPLRERLDDIAPLVEQFVALASAKHSTLAPQLSREVMDAFRTHPWPGNVRELKNLIELVCILCEGKLVRVVNLPRTFRTGAARTGAATPYAALIDQPLRETIHGIFDAALRAESGNRSRAARRLGISLRTMQRQVAKLRRGT
jgi:transcriptional regulator with PAS, ATPase and Fis domain